MEVDAQDMNYQDNNNNRDHDEEESNRDIGMKYYDDEASDSEDENLDDPIVDTIPIHLNASVKDNSLAPLLLQFPTKQRQSNLTQSHISALHKLQIKTDSGVVELRLPLDTNKFFSESVSTKYNVSEQVLRGVIIHDEPAGKVSGGNIPSVSALTKDNEGNVKVKEEHPTSVLKSTNSSLSSIRTQPGTVGGSRYLVGVQDDEGRLHLTPISDTCMLRPHFKYIDNAKMSKIERERERERELNDNANSNGGNKEDENDSKQRKKNVSVVTMSAKSSKENIPRLGGALLSAKLESEEDSKEYAVIACDREFVQSHFVEKTGNILQSKLSQQEYLDLLLDQTKL